MGGARAGGALDPPMMRIIHPRVRGARLLPAVVVLVLVGPAREHLMRVAIKCKYLTLTLGMAGHPGQLWSSSDLQPRRITAQGITCGFTLKWMMAWRRRQPESGNAWYLTGWQHF